MANMFMVKLLVLFSITMVALDSVNGQIGMAHIVALLKHISDTSANTQSQMANALTHVGATQNRTVNTLTHVEATQNQMANTLTQIEMSEAQMSKTLTEIATTQTQMANTFNQVVNLLERQGQQLQNMTLTLKSVESVLENQHETLGDINRSLPLVLNQQESQIEFVNASQSTNESCNPNLDSQDQEYQNATAVMGTVLPPQPANDCSEINSQGVFSTGRYTIYPSNCPISFDIRCDMDTDGGKWTIFQRRFNGCVDFFRGWDDYETGFGSADGEYWMGLSQIHCMTQSGNWQLRIDMEAFDGDTAYAVYDSFNVGNASTNYRLTIGTYSGAAGDSLSRHNNMAFSTKDRDNDNGSRDCANEFKGGWWYNNCYYSNLNGLYLGSTGDRQTGNVWHHWKVFQSLKKTEMKIRRVQ